MIHQTKCQCGECGETAGPMFVHSLCHPDSPTWASMQDGVLTVECGKCRKPIVSFEIGQMIDPNRRQS